MSSGGFALMQNKNDVLATPPFSETIPQGVLIKIEMGKVKNIKNRNVSVIKLVKN